MTSDKQPRVLMIGGRDHTFERLSEMNIKYVVYQYPSLVSDFIIKNAESVWVGDYENIDLVTQLAKAMHENQPFDAVMSFAEYGFWPAAQIAISLDIPSNCDARVVELTRNKLSMRYCMNGAGINNVPFSLIKSHSDLKCFVEKHGASIVKPSCGGGSEGVSLVEKEDDFYTAMSRAANVGRGEIIVEKFIGGKEFSVETISKKGIHEIAAITEKITTGAPYFVESGHVQPAQLDNMVHEQICQSVMQLLTAIGYQTGPAHTEVKVEDCQVYIIETQIRNGGDQIWELTLNTSGIDLFKETFSTFFNLPQPSRKPKTPAQAIKYLLPSHILVSKITGVDIALISEGVQRVDITAKIGQRFDEVNHSGVRGGYLLANGISKDDAWKNASCAIELIEIQ
jgi:biotin carboxylase